MLHENFRKCRRQVKTSGDEGQEKEGRDKQGHRGPGRICRLCWLVDLRGQSELTSVLLEERTNQGGEMDDAEMITRSPRS